jgi:pSer/pThr/pTyr-binding forkhead associated (FHA) protein
MGTLKHRTSERETTLLPEHVVGRSGSASLRLELPLVSGQHAVVRWTGVRWEARDLGSRNGTSVNGTRLSPRSIVAP